MYHSDKDILRKKSHFALSFTQIPPIHIRVEWNGIERRLIIVVYLDLLPILPLYSPAIILKLSEKTTKPKRLVNLYDVYYSFVFCSSTVFFCFSPKCTFYFLPNREASAAFPSSKSLQQYIAVVVVDSNRFLILLAFAFRLHIQEGETNLTIKSALKLQ